MITDDAVRPLYEGDYAGWLSHQAAALLRHDLTELDRENLLEELKGLLSNDHIELQQALGVLMVHLLMCEHQPRRKVPARLSALTSQRMQVRRILSRSPSLSRQLGEFAATEYPHAVRQAVIRTGLPKSAFPAALPYSVAQLMDDDFVP